MADAALMASGSAASQVGPVILATLEGRSNLFIVALYRAAVAMPSKGIFGPGEGWNAEWGNEEHGIEGERS